jgi:predicted dehydrogenase
MASEGDEMKKISRRRFLKGSVGAVAGMAIASGRRSVAASDKIIAGVMGIRGRGDFLARAFAARPDAEVAYLSDVDSRLFDSRAKAVEAAQGKKPKTVQDVRRILDDPEVNVLVIATPDHWHALGTVWACQAGKDVYVEKPASHSIWEGRKMVEAARKYRRVVQLGTQTRSGPYAKNAVEFIRSGKLGDVHLVRVLNMKTRGVLPERTDEPVPKGLDYDKWLGPAPERPYNANRFYGGCWNWFWDFSGGDIVNDGVHQIDLARWVVGEDYPKTVSTTGGIFHFHDGGETPDTQIVTYEYEKLTMVFELTLWTPYMKKTAQEIRVSDQWPDWPFNATKVEVFGTDGFMWLGRHGGGWKSFGRDGEEGPCEYGRDPFPQHLENFLSCVRSRKKPNADIETGHLSTLLCHLGNISYRVGNRKLIFDGESESFVGDEKANRYVKREYRNPYVIPEVV